MLKVVSIFSIVYRHKHLTSLSGLRSSQIDAGKLLTHVWMDHLYCLPSGFIDSLHSAACFREPTDSVTRRLSSVNLNRYLSPISLIYNADGDQECHMTLQRVMSMPMACAPCMNARN